MIIVPWGEANWLEQVHTWIEAALESQGMRIHGPITQPHIRPWSTVLHVPTSGGDVYFKATAPSLLHEVAITQYLATRYPEYVLPLLALDSDRGWMLLPAGGVPLRQVIRADRDLRHWERLLPIYAELQIDLGHSISELLTLGAPDRRPATLPAQYIQLLETPEALGIDQSEGITTAELHQLWQLVPRTTELCEQLSSNTPGASLHHGDLHDGNIFLHNQGFRFFDWGDSSVAHPFFSLRTAFVSVEISLGLEEGAPEFARLRDAYLEPWTRSEPLKHLQILFEQVQPFAALCGALTWHHVVSQLPPDQQEAYAEPVPSLLREFLSATM